MKKGFTLIELLIVMVLVGVLVTVALPKYYASMERGRAMEGINNLRAASEYMNARYVMDGNQYLDFKDYKDSNSRLMGDFTKSVYFSEPELNFKSSGNGNVTFAIKATRLNSEYYLQATNTNGELTKIYCYPKVDAAKKICESIGFELVGSSYVMDFTK